MKEENKSTFRVKTKSGQIEMIEADSYSFSYGRYVFRKDDTDVAFFVGDSVESIIRKSKIETR